MKINCSAKSAIHLSSRQSAPSKLFCFFTTENSYFAVRHCGCTADAFTSKIIHSAKSSAHIIIFPIVLTILAESRRDSFTPFRRHAMNDFVSDYKSPRVHTAVRQNRNLLSSFYHKFLFVTRGNVTICKIYEKS